MDLCQSTIRKLSKKSQILTMSCRNCKSSPGPLEWCFSRCWRSPTAGHIFNSELQPYSCHTVSIGLYCDLYVFLHCTEVWQWEPLECKHVICTKQAVIFRANVHGLAQCFDSPLCHGYSLERTTALVQIWNDSKRSRVIATLQTGRVIAHYRTPPESQPPCNI